MARIEVETNPKIEGIELVNVERLPSDHPRMIEAMTNERLRRAGTHVYHPGHGVVTLREAEKLIRRYSYERSEFKGDPESGVVAQWDEVIEIGTAPSAPAPAPAPAPAAPASPILTADTIAEAIRKAFAVAPQAPSATSSATPPPSA